MIYKIVWKRKNTTYTEYLSIEGLKSCLDFIDTHDDCELIKVEPNTEDQPINNNVFMEETKWKRNNL